MRPLAILTLIAVAAMAPSFASAVLRTVDDSGGEDFLTIGEAVAASSEGDTIYVMPGTYDGPQNRGIQFDDTNLVIMSDAGPSQTTVDCEGQDRAFYVTGVHDTTTVIEGLRIVNGYGGATPPFASGGAIYLHSGSSAIIRDCEFDGNTAVTGGAIAIGDGNDARIRGCAFTNNTATAEAPLGGGAIHGNYDVSIVSGCEFEGNGAYNGGAILLYYSQTTVRDCDFLNGNTATNGGGGIYLEQSPCATIQRCTFTENVAEDGGGVGCYSSSALIEDCTFTSNEATDEGGGIWAGGSDAGPTVMGCAFQGNTAVHGAGALVTCDTATITGCTFDTNTTSNMGGGLYLAVSEFTVTDCTFTGNTAHGQGGGLRMSSPDSALISGCAFSGNHADGDGAGIVCYYGTADIEDCSFLGNTTDEEGGGLYGQEFSPNMTLCTFTENTARRGGGFGFMQDSAPVITQCTIHENTANFEGGGVYWDGSSGSMRTTTIEGNAAPTGGGIYFQGEAGTIEETIVAFSTEGVGIVVSGPGPEITHCCVYGNAAGDSLGGNFHHNMFENPLFCDAANDDYTLCADSPCAEANNDWDLLIGAHDIGCPECGGPVEDRSWGTIKAMFR